MARGIDDKLWVLSNWQLNPTYDYIDRFQLLTADD